ncbi:hypothetical protein PY32053_02765 [Paracoccus yeei]|uniref:Uncharacterized protein n=1 Tax=Paracoccus yeei TaxID=147645 RepID=A0A386UPI1_9RHOB|nr:hypothetical protein PY32053_02765 [Paracoccus yeei]
MVPLLLARVRGQSLSRNAGLGNENATLHDRVATLSRGAGQGGDGGS